LDLQTLLPAEAQVVLGEQWRLAYGVPGDVAELGVYLGGTAAEMARAAGDRLVHCFDTFVGMRGCPIHPKDWHKAGDFADVPGYVIPELQKWPNVRIYKGVFPATAAGFKARLSFVHLDADLYQSTLDGLKVFYPLLNPGGIILIDDYGRDTCPGVAAAVEASGLAFEIVGEGQARVVK
jgi:O-methyltransferase